MTKPVTGARAAAPIVEFYVRGGTNGREYVADTTHGTYVIRRENTTHAYPRGAGNPRYFTYLNGIRRPGSDRLLAEAQQRVRREAK